MGFSTGLSANEGEPSAFLRNVFIRDTRVSDVKRETVNGVPIIGPGDVAIAGILLQSVERPVLCNNSVSDTVNGIVFTGSDLINPPFFFQLATSPTAAELISKGVIPAIPANGLVNLTGTGTGVQTFTNLSPNSTGDVDIDAAVQVKVGENGIDTSSLVPALNTDLNSVNWQAGNTIRYNANGGGLIGGLTENTDFFLVVYVPGFTRDGLVQDNKVDNCRVSGYRDDRVPTESIWTENTAVLNGPAPTKDQNYVIEWDGLDPIDEGTVQQYPASTNKYHNLAIKKS